MVRYGPYPTAGPRGPLDRVVDGGPQALPPARATVPPWPHASTMIQWRQPSARAWLRLDWCIECLQNMTSGKCQKTSDTSSRSHDHTPTRPSKRWPWRLRVWLYLAPQAGDEHIDAAVIGFRATPRNGV